jgi:hypothetical protein
MDLDFNLSYACCQPPRALQPFNSNKAEERRVQLKKERQNCIDIFLVTNFYLSTSSDLIYK